LIDIIKNTKQTSLILLVVVFIMLTGNYSLFHGIVSIYPLTLKNLPFLISLTLFFTSLTAIFFLTICQHKATRWILALFLIIVAQSAYFMDHFKIIIDTVMIDNTMETNYAEFSSLVTLSLIARTILLGIMPAWLVIKLCPKPVDFKTELKSRLRTILLFLLALILLVLPFTADYTSFIREHKIIRFYSNPTYSVYSAIKYGAQQSSISSNLLPLIHIADDGKIVDTSSDKKELIIMVVGETARADRFSLNGYKRETNPLLSKQNIISLRNVLSCGTSTGVSVPCMFSSLGRKHYDKKKVLAQENALDVLAKNGVEVLWRDNNSDSKGVALRATYEDFKTPSYNPICEGECRDIGMLSGLDEYIKKHSDKDIFIVLHQMGNHGPEYYRRYPKEFERFKPACQTDELRDCSQQEIDNAYDNAILYTDYFLSEVIQFLKKYDANHATAMLYVADHGESLGEHGVYLHAAPYSIAPKEQTHVPVIIWFGQNFDYQLKDIAFYKEYPLSQDDLFCSLLTLYEVNTRMCKNEHEMLSHNKNLKSSTFK
jgi:lipid A ethanolaminephosphotransferase